MASAEGNSSGRYRQAFLRRKALEYEYGLEEFCIERALIDEARLVVDRLRERGLSVVTAESCTAGLIAAVLTYSRRGGVFPGRLRRIF